MYITEQVLVTAILGIVGEVLNAPFWSWVHFFAGTEVFIGIIFKDRSETVIRFFLIFCYHHC